MRRPSSAGAICIIAQLLRLTAHWGTGREFVNDGKGTRIGLPNITPAGVVARHQPEDWNSVIRHGVKPNGRPVLVMPSEDCKPLHQRDPERPGAYVRQFPPKEGAQA